MDKQVQFFGSTEAGVFCQALFGESGLMEKTAGAKSPFSNWETKDAISKFISTITEEMKERYCYVLVNALGAGEYFGANINSDYFPWDALSHEGMDYGYKTFLSANVFMHHRNKDPTRAFGRPVLSVMNTRMKRVELIVALDRAKAVEEGADGVIARIDAGEFPDVSMGCRVPFDVCSICGHKSKTKKDYCQCMRPPPELRGVLGPNRILSDGRQICVYNTFPRFFDLSFVFIGADKTAKVMAKLASRGAMMCFGDVCAVPRLSTEIAELVDGGDSEDGFELILPKVASAHHEGDEECSGIDKLAASCGCKTASQKMAEIIKQVPAGHFALRRLPEIEKIEPDLPPGVLDSMSSVPLTSLLSGTTGAGVILKPHEFQRIVLKKMGEDDLADTMHSGNMVFRQVHDFHDVQLEEDMLSSLRMVLPMLMRYIHARTAFGEPFQMRVIIQHPGSKLPLPTRSSIEHPLLDKISAAYNGYRRDVLLKLSQATEVVESDPELRKTILGDELMRSFVKTAAESPIVSTDTMAYLMGAHLEDRSLLSSTFIATAMGAFNEGLPSQESAA